MNYSELKRNELLRLIRQTLEGADLEALTVKANVLAVPVVLDDEDKTEGTFTITVTYKKGSREGELYDPYTEAQMFREKQAEKAQKAEEARKKKEADQRKREEEKRKREEAKKKKEEEKRSAELDAREAEGVVTGRMVQRMIEKAEAEAEETEETEE